MNTNSASSYASTNSAAFCSSIIQLFREITFSLFSTFFNFFHLSGEGLGNMFVSSSVLYMCRCRKPKWYRSPYYKSLLYVTISINLADSSKLLLYLKPLMITAGKHRQKWMKNVIWLKENFYIKTEKHTRKNIHQQFQNVFYIYPI